MVAISPKKKTCSYCGNTLPFETGFYDNKKAPDGKSYGCKPCDNACSMEYEAQRLAEPMCARAEAMKRLYGKRFRVIKAARLSMDEEGLVIQNKIDRVLKKHGLYSGIRITHGSLKRKSKRAKL